MTEKKLRPIKKEQQKTEQSIFKKTWYFLWKDDSMLSWIISILLALIIVKFIFFPLMSLIFSTQLPLVVVESPSMHHDGSFLKGLIGFSPLKKDSFETWWKSDFNYKWYEENSIKFSETENWPFKSGMDQGDIIVVRGVKPEKIKIGDVIIFEANQQHPIIHRVVKIKENNDLIFETKGDNNENQLKPPYPIDETNIHESHIIGKAVFRVPKIGWLKLGIVKLWNFIAGIF